jgi:uncharacterized protein
MLKKRSRKVFASMDKDKLRMVQSRGGKTAHALGKAHTWTREEARLAGKKGGKVLTGPRLPKILGW